MEKDYSLVIAATVAIVAIVGLILYFGQASTGALHYGLTDVARNSKHVTYVDYGTAVAEAYPGEMEQNEWCSTGCSTSCYNQLDKFECNDYCRTQCNYLTRNMIELFP